MAIFRASPEYVMTNCLLHIAEAAHRRGHEITVYTHEWNGAEPDYIRVVRFPITAKTYQKRTTEFFTRLAGSVRTDATDVVLGFNRGPGLDFYFSGGNCFVYTEKQTRSGMYRFFNREYAARAALEQEVFSPESKTRIFYFSEEQKAQFIRTFNTPASRFCPLPPAANQNCRRTAEYENIRHNKRRIFSAGPDDVVLIQVAINMLRKGVDRTILAVAALPEAIRSRIRLCLIGRETEKLRQLAESTGIARQTFFEGPQFDLRDYLYAADMMIHPARVEVTGPMLLEALDAGVPVLCTDNCGYADYIVNSHAGGTVTGGHDFDQMELNAALLSFLCDTAQLRLLSRDALDFMRHYNTFSYADTVVNTLEQKGSHATR